jgi:hypothetical protein
LVGAELGWWQKLVSERSSFVAELGWGQKLVSEKSLFMAEVRC